MEVATVPLQIIRGIYLGLLTGIVPALVAFGLGFLFRYITKLTIPAFAVIVFAIAVAGVNGGLMALADPTIVGGTNSISLIVALLVVLMLALYAHNQGDTLGARLPHRLKLSNLQTRTLSKNVVDLVGSRGQARIEIAGAIRDIEGYPPLPDSLRQEIQETEWTFPADLPLTEIENRFRDQLRNTFDLSDATVSIDAEGRATVAAAPPAAGVSKRVGPARRAVSISSLLPTGIARGDEVRVLADGLGVEGTVVSARSSPGEQRIDTPTSSPEMSGESPIEEERPTTAPTTTGGEGRLTIAASRADATDLLAVDRGNTVVTSRGSQREYELFSILKQAGHLLEKITIPPESPLDDATIGDIDYREKFAVGILALRHDDVWRVLPEDRAKITAGDELILVGTRDDLRRAMGELA